MTEHWLVVLLSLSAALAFAGSTSFKHISAGEVPDAPNLAPSTLGRLVRATLSHRLWLAGMCCDVLGLSLQVLALHLGSLSVVQPLLLTSLLFALIIRGRLDRHWLSQRQTLWAVTLTSSLGGFLLLAASPASAVHEAADPLPAVTAGIVGVIVVGTCIVLGRRRSSAGRAAALLGTAVGTIYAPPQR